MTARRTRPALAAAGLLALSAGLLAAGPAAAQTALTPTALTQTALTQTAATRTTPAPDVSGRPSAVAVDGEACPEGEGASVLVDPQALTSPVLAGPTVGCAADPADGLTALVDAGFEVTESSPGFVCTLDAVPSPEQADCSADGYWAYFYAAPGEEAWTSSQGGAGDRTPEQGGVEAWSWTSLEGNEDFVAAQPRVLPAAVVAQAAAVPTADPTQPGGVPAAGEDAVAEDGPPVLTIAVVGVLVVLVVVAGLVAARRRRQDLEQHGRRGPVAPDDEGGPDAR